VSQLSIAMSIVCAHYGVSKLDMVSDRRARQIARPRQVFCWIVRHETQRSLPRVGAYLGGRDHTTIMHAVKKIDELRADIGFQLETDTLRARVRAALRGPTVRPDHERLIELHLSIQRARLKRLAVTDPERFERKYGDSEVEAL
jgi:hypothetical protein